MPIYEFICENCCKVCEFVMGFYDIDTKNKKIVDLKDLGFKCDKCDCTKFRKKISAHGKNSMNWAQWSNTK